MLQNLPEDTIERELNRAINKTDYFRAFKMHADNYGFSCFAVFRLSAHQSEETLGKLCIIADLPGDGRSRLEDMQVADHAALLATLSDLRKPRVWQQPAPEIAAVMPSTRVVAIPAEAQGGEKFTLLLGDTQQLRDEGETAAIIYDFSNAMRRFAGSESLDADTPKFRKREIEVIEWTAEGKTSADIAIILGLSEYTVNEYIASAMKKLDAVNRIHLVTKAIRLGIIV